MSYPNEPSISTSYTAKEQALGDGSFPGQELDVDLEALKTAYIELLTFVKGITRSDGKLANGSVQPETLGAGITLNFEPPEAWETGRAYSVGQTTFESNVFYICTSAHTSTVFADDLSSGRWDVLVDFTTEAAAAVAARDAALLAQSAAESARDDAESARDDAQTARDTASGHATTASTQAGIASSAASTASGAATAAGVSESNAGTSETNAANDAAAAAASAAAAATFDPANFAEIEDRAPPGMVGFTAATTAPAGWLIRDGAAVSRTVYAELFAEIGTTFGAGDGSTTFNLPDGRAEFDRGLDLGRGIDTGRVLGSAQADQADSIRSFAGSTTGTSQGTGDEEVPDGGGYSGFNSTGRGTADTFWHLRMRKWGRETRPRNIAYTPIIKY